MRYETIFDAGKLIVVQATIVGPRGTTIARMLLDTGATMTTVSPDLLDLVGYNPRDGVRRTRVQSAVGEEHGYKLPLAAFTALGFTLNDHLANVFDLGHEDIADGLIGMNFLNQFNYEIRSAEGRILVEKIAP
jgi:predicted aspartyl protease